MVKTTLRQMWFGIAVTVIIITAAAIFNVIYGDVYGRWGWMEISAALLIAAVCCMAGIEAFMRQPNPYTRTYALYNMQDIAPHDSLQGEGFGWMIQMIPAVLAAVVLIVVVWLT